VLAQCNAERKRFRSSFSCSDLHWRTLSIDATMPSSMFFTLRGWKTHKLVVNTHTVSFSMSHTASLNSLRFYTTRERNVQVTILQDTCTICSHRNHVNVTFSMGEMCLSVSYTYGTTKPTIKLWHLVAPLLHFFSPKKSQRITLNWLLHIHTVRKLTKC